MSVRFCANVIPRLVRLAGLRDGGVSALAWPETRFIGAIVREISAGQGGRFFLNHRIRGGEIVDGWLLGCCWLRCYKIK